MYVCVCARNIIIIIFKPVILLLNHGVRHTCNKTLLHDHFWCVWQT